MQITKHVLLHVLNKITPMPMPWIGSGNDLAMEFLRRIDGYSENADTVAIDFNIYRKVSLKYTEMAANRR